MKNTLKASHPVTKPSPGLAEFPLGGGIGGLRAIETLYRGFRFRSRTEARWAVFMDAISVRYIYEPDAYNLDGVIYLPDFFLPEMDCFVEIKPTKPSGAEISKAQSLAEHSGKKVFIMWGVPEMPKWETMSDNAMAFFADGGDDYGYLWCECGWCNHVGIEYEGRSDRLTCNCPKDGDKGRNFDSRNLMLAYNRAKGWRFDPKGGFGQ